MSNMLMALAALTMVFPDFSSLSTTETSFIMLRKFLWTLLFLLNISSEFIAFVSLSKFSFRFKSFFVEFTVFAHPRDLYSLKKKDLLNVFIE